MARSAAGMDHRKLKKIVSSMGKRMHLPIQRSLLRRKIIERPSLNLSMTLALTLRSISNVTGIFCDLANSQVRPKERGKELLIP